MTGPATSRPVGFGDLTRGQQHRLVGLQALVVGAVPDLVVAVVRQVRGRRGAQVGPTLVSVVLAGALPPVGRWALRRRDRVGAVVVAGAVTATVAAPVAAAGVRWTVVGSGSPWSAAGISAAVRLVTSAATIVDVVRSLPAIRARLADEQLSGA